MSGPVDVLADLDELIGLAEESQDYCSETGPSESMRRAVSLKEIRAVVVGMRDALFDLDEAYCDAHPDMTKEQRQFGRKALIAARAALANFKAAP